MMYFSTLFDSNYISKGIALYLSIERYTQDFTMYVMAMDRKCQQMLSTMKFTNMVVACIDDFSDSELLRAKNNRSRAEYCWTCGPYITFFFLHQYDLPEIAYLDSDLMFFSSPKVVLDELKTANASVGVVPHFKKYNPFGIYNVEFVYFKNDENGKNCLKWWRDECLKWCYNKLEEGKYGDQKYLEYFSLKFDNVHSIENRGVGIASFNMDQYKFRNGMLYYNNQSWSFVFFHYCGFKFEVENNVLKIRHTMYVNNTVLKTFVEPYSELMRNVYTKYLNSPITNICIEPIARIDYSIKTIIYFLNKVLPVDWIVGLVIRLKYRKRNSPYSEKL